MEDRLLTVPEAATFLAVKPATVYKWIYERRIPFVKLRGRAVRLRLSALEKIISQDECPALRSLAERD